MVISISSADDPRLTEDDLLLKKITEQFNVTLTFQSVSAEDSSHTYRLMAAAGALPDVILYDSNWDFSYFIQTNAIRAIPDNMSRYPHLRALIAYPFSSALQYDGKLWGIPRDVYQEERYADIYCVLVYNEIFERLSLPAPERIGDWVNFLRAIKTTYPDIIPIVSSSPSAMFNLTYYDSPATKTWTWQDQRYVPGFYTDAFCESIQSLRTLWDEGLLDPDFMNTGSGCPSGQDQFLMGQAAAMILKASPHEWMNSLIPCWENLYPDVPIEEALRILFLPANTQGEYPEVYTLDMSAVYFSANVDDAKMERILSILDYLCSEEGKRLRRYGIEGEDYTRSEDGECHRIAHADGSYPSLYKRYPSYALIRTLPTLDTDFLWADEALNPLILRLREEYLAWRSKHAFSILHSASLRANLLLPVSSVFFHPDIPAISFRMLCAEEGVENCFETIKQEFIDQGIDSIIDKVYYNLR